MLISPDLERPIAIPWVVAKDMSLEEMLKAIEKVLQSNENFYLHAGVTLVIKHVSVPIGGVLGPLKSYTVASLSRNQPV